MYLLPLGVLCAPFSVHSVLKSSLPFYAPPLCDFSASSAPLRYLSLSIFVLRLRLSKESRSPPNHRLQIFHRANHPRRAARTAHRSAHRPPRRTQIQSRRHTSFPESAPCWRPRPLRRVPRHPPNRRDQRNP